MTTYSATEIAVAALLEQQLSALVSRADFRILDTPGFDSAFVLIQGGDSQYGEDLGDEGSHGEDMARHRISVIVARKRSQNADGVSYVAIQSLTDSAVDLFTRYPRLNNSDGIKHCEVQRVRPVLIRRDSPHLLQIIDLDILTTDEPFLMETPA